MKPFIASLLPILLLTAHVAEAQATNAGGATSVGNHLKLPRHFHLRLTRLND